MPDSRFACCALFVFAATAAAQGPTLDADRTVWSTATIRANGTWEGRPAFIVRTSVHWADRRYRIEDNGGVPCALVIADGGELTVERARVELRGDLLMREGGRANLVDVQLELQCSYPREFNVDFAGGHLDTNRVQIGGRAVGAQICNFYLDAGLWTAHDTVVSYSGGILLGVRDGRFGDPARRGGTLIADGLHQGIRGDFLHMSGAGDAVLRNSAYGVTLNLWDGGQTGETVLDVPRDHRFQHAVLGDPAVHDASPTRAAVTDPIPMSPWRLELENTLVPRWEIHFFDVGGGTRARTYRLRDAESVGIGIHADDLNGSPTLVGPWRSYYPAGRPLPGLPTVSEPGGEHGIPPGCGLTIGSVTILSDASQWSYVTHWGLYLDARHGSVFRVDGPMSVVEVYLWNVDLTLAGTGAYDAAVTASTLNVRGTARLRIENAIVGSPASLQGEIAAAGAAVVEFQDVKLRRLLFRTGPQLEAGPYQGIDAATITVRNAVPSTLAGEVVTVRENRTGSVTFVDRTNAAAIDTLDNLDFEDGVSGAVVPHWALTGASGSASTDQRPNAETGQQRSLRYSASGSTGSLRKSVPFPAGVGLELTGWARTVSGSGTMTCAVRGASGGQVSTTVAAGGSWAPFHVGPFVVGTRDTTVDLVFAHGGATGNFVVGLDDLELRVTNWWEDDNLSNLAFEAPYIHQVALPNSDRHPDGWALLDGVASVETSDVIRGNGLRIDARGTKAVLRKRLRFVSPGQTITFSGHAKAVHGSTPFRAWVQVGEAERYWDRSWPGNAWAYFDSGTGWQPFSLTYVVPSGADNLGYSTLAIHGGTGGDVLFVDECAVTIR